MSLADDIRAYIESKDEEGHNKVKKEFFADILDKLRTGSLSVDYLNEKIAALKTNRALLFYKRMRGKPAISSQAAQLVARIYETYLGIPIHDLSLAIIVAEGISKTNALKISRYPYEAWLKYPFSVAKQVYLNRQLLSDLKLPIPAETNVYILSTALKKELDKQNINLSTSCLTVLQRAPDYLPILINQLFSQYKSEDRADEFAEHLTNQMLVLIQDKDPALIERNQQLIHALSQVDVAILAKLTAAHPLFFLSLNSPSQKEVLNSFSPAETRELERYLNEYLREDPVVATHQLSSISDFLAKEGEAAQSSSMILISLRERVKERLGERAELFIHREQATKALNAIESYLLLNPNAYKDEIFYELGLEIKRKGQITVEMLENALKAADRHKLFAKWSGPTRSRAAQLMTQLFTIATLGEVLLPQDQQRMILTGSLPHVDTLADKFDNAVTERIETVLVKPETAQESWLGRIIESELSVYKSVANVAKYNLGKNHQRAEAIYQQFLITKGIAIAEKQTQPIFDTQGHILIEVSLTQEDMDELITIISEGNETRGSLEKLAEAMGVGRITGTTFCNLDISFNEGLHAKFLHAVGASTDKEIAARLQGLFDKKEQGSVIPLQEEMTMHVFLALRALERVLLEKDLLQPGESLLTMEEKQQLLAQINKQVLHTYTQALNYSTNIAALNKELDSSRKKLSADARELLHTMLRKKISNSQNIEALKAAVSADLNESYFTGTTASGSDYLHTDASNHLTMRVSATEETAHNKRRGANKQAFRPIARNLYYPNEKEAVVPFKRQAVEARVPSIAVLKLKENAVSDVAEKLAVDVAELHLRNPAYRGPVIYNLLTSLYTRIGDIGPGANHQRESAKLIIQGAHLYNKKKLEEGKLDGLVYVQNIPVNQHTLELNHEAFDDVAREATLMAHMAMLSTLVSYRSYLPVSLNQSLYAASEKLRAYYFTYLKQERNNSDFFKDSFSGKMAQDYFEGMREKWNSVNIQAAEDNLHALVAQVLFKALASGDYRIAQFGMLMQTMSIFLEPASLAGCKSANERYQAVSGRVALLWSMTEPARDLTPGKLALLTNFKAYIEGKATMNDVQRSLDTTYNRSTLYGGACCHSHVDQGGPSKLEKTNKPSGKLSFFDVNTNIAESGYVDRLAQKNASCMQAHKLAGKMLKEFQDEFASCVPANAPEPQPM